MRLEWERPGVLRVTTHAYEFATLVAAARHVSEHTPDELPEEALDQLRQVLAEYDEQARRLHGRERTASKE
ncbi:hypothetical protein [Streptomyces alkaliterrae]|uniref:Uncharacterized protein n=1 Tax=Streptomyces alkaliterrae TaxID=2213162 RepID=A0A5P0YSN8_9ACTN|nr:hypothetical protein [Streptomyces alkaliterrae]MBB1254146.1 hypothetical protein [Streptomyces alkaliterrae]MBB1260038.1 hypothetical protein [Streptomyces alkaliterrae]MQS01509.1 hypothetical protein [Streptomyces alkaliterrae]